MNNFGKNLFSLRGINKLNAVDLGQKTGIPKATIDYYELDEGEQILEHLITLADFFGVSIDDLVRGDCTEVPTVEKPKKSKWQINSRGDAIKLSDAFRFYATIYPATKDVKNWVVFASYPGDDVPVEYFETEEEAKEYILELVNSR